MAYPPQQPPYQQGGYGQPGPPPQGVYGQPQPPYGYAPQQPQPQAPYGYAPQQPMMPQHPGSAVTAPVWSIGEILLVLVTCGLALPIVMMKHRAKTTVTRYR